MMSMHKRVKRGSRFYTEDEDQPTAKSKRKSSKNFKNRGTSQTQPSTSSASQSQVATTETTKKSVISPAELLQLSHAAVFYIIAGSSTKVPISHTEIIKTILSNHNSRCYPQLIDKINEVLLEIFGFKLMSMDDKPITKCDKLTTVNALGSPTCMVLPQRDEEKGNQVLLCLLLNCILMSGGHITEEAMFDFMEALNIKPLDKDNETFGSIPARLSAYKSQMYLKYELNKTLEPPAIMVSWGARAHLEISKREVFKFISKCYPEVAMADLAIQDSDKDEEDEEDDEREQQE